MATILLAEDDEPIRTVYAKWLQKAGHTVHEVANGIDGLYSRIIEGAPDLVITDVMMPRSDGEKLTIMLGMYENACNVMVVTAFADSKKLERLRKEPNVKAVLTKPVSRDEFIGTVESLLQEAQENKTADSDAS